MNDKPLIFLFTCVYNDKKRINKLFDSIKKQTANNFVYFLYNDCSTDGEYENLFKKLKSDLENKGIKAYYEIGKKNLGINKATEHCLCVLRDKFKECTHFAWINSDDWLDTNYIKYISKAIVKHMNYALYIPNIYIVDENSSKLTKYSTRYMRKSFTYLIDNFNSHQVYSHFTANKELFFKINPTCLIYDNLRITRFYNDNCVLFLFSVFLQKSFFISKPLSYFLKRNDALSAKAIGKSTDFSVQLDYLKQINPSQIDLYTNLMKVSLTHSYCVKLVENKNFKDVKQYYKNSKKLVKDLNLNKRFIFIQTSSYLLYYFPRLYYLIHLIKKKLF